jgi:hypothetical protein
MKVMIQLFTKGDIRKAVDAISGPVKCRNFIGALTTSPPEIITHGTDNDNDPDGYGSLTANEEYVVQDFIRIYTLNTNGIPYGCWLDT